MKNSFQWTNGTSNFQNIPGRDLHKEKLLFLSKIPQMNLAELLETVQLYNLSFDVWIVFTNKKVT